MCNIGRKIICDFCNGYFNSTDNLAGSRIESEGYDWIVIRKPNGSCEFENFTDYEQKQKLSFKDILITYFGYVEYYLIKNITHEY